MIAFIKGNIFAFGSDYLIIENNGIGYRVNFTRPEKLQLNSEMTIYTYQHVREDELSLFGFLSLDEYNLFVKLINVKGLGPKTALNILGYTSVDNIINAIETKDVEFIKRFPGIGNKTASQIILDLKGKLVSNDNNISESQDIKDALEALKALGYKTSEIAFLSTEFRKEKCSTDEYIKMGLKLLHNKKRGQKLDRILQAEKINNDEDLALRPESLIEYVGQHELKSNLEVFIKDERRVGKEC